MNSQPQNLALQLISVAAAVALVLPQPGGLCKCAAKPVRSESVAVANATTGHACCSSKATRRQSCCASRSSSTAQRLDKASFDTCERDEVTLCRCGSIHLPAPTTAATSTISLTDFAASLHAIDVSIAHVALEITRCNDGPQIEVYSGHTSLERCILLSRFVI
jgi:hypothetical protein